MKIVANIRVFFIAAALLLSQDAAAVKPDDVVSVFKEVSDNLKSGDADKLSVRFASPIDLRVLAAEKTCSARQAAEIVEEFFVQRKVVSFSMLHVGGKAGKHYGIGLLIAGDRRFRVTVLLLVSGRNSYTIQQLGIDYEN
ncbi:MAG: DUF4783 domain-containing protein [Prevotellaceae bacterium]|nr:DUF4783 domain-containing protein [Prevotellaceae bacterium]